MYRSYLYFNKSDQFIKSIYLFMFIGKDGEGEVLICGLTEPNNAQM